MTTTFTSTDEHLFQVQATIERCGFQITGVLGDQHRPEYTYTTGFLLHGQPEVVVIGQPSEAAAGLLHQLYRTIGLCQRWPTGREHLHHSQGLPFHLLDVPEVHYTEDECLLVGIPCYYEAIAPDARLERAAVQLVWPDPTGRFPWDPLVEPTVWRDQPILADGDPPVRRSPLPYPLDERWKCDECRREGHELA
jgi:hypothetical protein